MEQAGWEENILNCDIWRSGISRVGGGGGNLPNQNKRSGSNKQLLKKLKGNVSERNSNSLNQFKANIKNWNGENCPCKL